MQGWNGIGYNFVIYKNGEVHEGRGLEYIGAHAGINEYNQKYVGICLVGNYEVTTAVPDAQFNSTVELIKYIQGYYSTAKTILRHSDVKATACPGKYFPWTELKNLKLRGDDELLSTEYTELKKLITDLTAQVKTLGEAVNKKADKGEPNFTSLEDVKARESWAYDTTKKLVDGGVLQGTGEQLDLSYDLLRTFVILDRMGKLD